MFSLQTKKAFCYGVPEVPNGSSAAISKENDTRLRIEEASVIAGAPGATPRMAHQFAACVLLHPPGKTELGDLSIGENGRLPHLLQER